MKKMGKIITKVYEDKNPSLIQERYNETLDGYSFGEFIQQELISEISDKRIIF